MQPSLPPPPPPPPPPPVRCQSLRQYRAQQHQQQQVSHGDVISSTSDVIGSNSDVIRFNSDVIAAGVDETAGDAILSSRGTVRGHRRRVRDSLQALERQAAAVSDPAKDSAVSAAGACADLPASGVVLYITSLTVIRPTFEACQAVRRILHTHRVQFEERNLLFNRAWHAACSLRPPPLLFIDGALIGGRLEVERLNESGQLARLLAEQPRLPAGRPAVGPSACAGCGGLRHVICPACRGSRRQRVAAATASAAAAAASPADFRLRCTACEATGMAACPLCSSSAGSRAAASAAASSLSAPASLRGARRLSSCGAGGAARVRVIPAGLD
ncbi:hypothetical protein BOX15_Mlig020514g2 [Macrostomum lignano]|uniref:Glutaredoxin domain-containing protein n=1 Tax=Macrostomum lignano TaxID=282301 RepID=A0A267F9H8_9PLAT|nr:hypothetical protein BOX15_Mlig012020g2 [Macrostomum lignano]PAA78855.1 hypothetical protein BOX15_Mlig020514g2 [Macrostomum lignano]